MEALPQIKVEMAIPKLTEILDSDIKLDSNTKTILFLLMINTYTDSLQQNADMTGPPSQGKTWMVNRLLWYFPSDNIEANAGATPRSFHYTQDRKRMVLTNGNSQEPEFEEIDWSKKPDKNSDDIKRREWQEYRRNFVYLIDYERKIVVFKDQPHYQLQENIRTILSHDQKFSRYQAVNVNRQTETTFIKGYFTNIICTAFTKQKAEERDRFWHLNPEWTQEKEKQVLDLIDRMNSDPQFENNLNTAPERVQLQLRVFAIREARINEVYIPEPIIKQTREWFNSEYIKVCSKKGRDYKRFHGLIQACAMFNLFNRKIELIGDKRILWCNETDLEAAKTLYKPLMKSNELGISPEAYDIWEKVVKPLLEQNDSVSTRDILRNYNIVFQRPIGNDRLKGFLTNFADIGLIEEEKQKGKTTLYFKVKVQDTEESFPQGTCWICLKPLPTDLKDTTILDGKTVHVECYQKTTDGIVNKQ